MSYDMIYCPKGCGSAIELCSPVCMWERKPTCPECGELLDECTCKTDYEVYEEENPR
jgi:hypothetical protein